MYYRDILKTLGSYLYFFALALAVPLVVSGYFQFWVAPERHPQPHTTAAFALTILICTGLAAWFRWLGRNVSGQLFRREGLCLVVVIWFLSAIIGGLPFYLSGTLASPVDAYFEAMSGLTTTGASVMHPKLYDKTTGEEREIVKSLAAGYRTDYRFWGTIEPVKDSETGAVLCRGVEAVGKGLLFWRSFMQWLGGMGIVVLFVAILPALGVGGRMLYQAEVPGPSKDAITPRVKETASMLWKLYLAMTCGEILLLCYTNPDIGWFESACITFSNLSTGGFSVRNSSIGSYHNVATEWVVIVFMLAGSINFSLYFHCLRGRFYRLYQPEFLVYLASLVLGACFVSYHLIGQPKDLLYGADGVFSTSEAFRYGTFHLLSAQTSTGFATANFDTWPWITQAVLLVVMYIGSMSGSTGGGIKIVRHYMGFRIVQNKIESLFSPERVHTFRVGNNQIDSSAAITVLTFYLVVISISVLGTFLYALDGMDLETSLAVTTCMINNIGMAFRAAGPSESFAFLTPFAKIFSTLLMVLGRLEFFAVLVILIPRFWRET